VKIVITVLLSVFCVNKMFFAFQLLVYDLLRCTALQYSVTCWRCV